MDHPVSSQISDQISDQISRPTSGQISIVAAALMGTTFFLFFAFVVNTGMLVHAKINLQNAADVAAYAGAASQARHLEHIGVLNYDLRRQYKRFLFRYYVIGNLGRPNRASGGKFQFGAVESGSGRFVDLGVPAVCLTFKANDDYCKIFNTTPITTGGRPSFLDAIGSALGEVLKNIEEIRQRNCRGLSEANVLALYLWLFNTNPEGSGNLISSLDNDPETQLALKTLPAITQGLGVIPRNLITLQRIKTLQKLVNRPAERGMNAGQASSLEQQNNPMVNERPLLAFKSAQRTLGGTIFNDEQLVMDELLPADPDGLLKLDPTFAEFNSYATFVKTETGNGDCRQRLMSIQVGGGSLPVAVSKEGPTTYYAVHLKAVPQLLFNPFDLTLEAYAAARPFGSRLGPAPGPELAREFSSPSNPSPAGSQGGKGPMTGGVPNLSLRPGERDGFYNASVFNGLRSRVVGPPGSTISPQTLVQAEGVASLPNLAEYGRYIIPTDFNSQADQPPNALDYKDYFVNGGFYSFYAPVSLDADGGKGAIENIVRGVPEPEGLQGLKGKLIKDLSNYFGKLARNQGEGGEGIQIARVRSPTQDTTGGDVGSLSGGITKIADADLRPWFAGTQLAPQRPASGRVGYSVKLVSFKSLQGSGASLSGSGVDDVAPYIDH